MSKRIRLSIREIDALLTAAGAADPEATFEHLGDKERDRMDAAWASAMGKLRDMLAQRKSA